MSWWYKIWQRSGYNHTRAKQNLPRRPRRASWRSWSRRRNQKSFTLTIPWNLASIVRNYPGIIVRQHHTDQKQMEDCRKSSAQSERRDICFFCCNQVWTMNGGRISRNVTAICEIFRISCLVGRHPMKGGSECHLTDQSFRLEHWSKYHPFSAKDPSRMHQFGKKVLPGLFLGYALYAVVNLERRHYVVADIEELEEMDASELHARRLNAQEVLIDAAKKWKLHIPSRRWNSQNLLEEIDVWNHPPSGIREQTLFKKTQRGMEAKNVLNYYRRFHRHHVESQTVHAERRIISHSVIDVTRATHTSLDVLLEQNIDDYWNVDGEREVIRCVDRLHKIHFIWRKATWRQNIVRGEIYEETNNLKTRQCMARNVEACVWCKRKAKRSKSKAIEKPKLDNARQLRGIFFIEPWWWKIQTHHEKRS